MMTEEDINLLIKKRKWKKLVTIGEPAVEPLLASLRHIHLSSLRFVLTTLGDIGDPRALEMLVLFLGSPNRFIACSAAASLGKIIHPGSVLPLIKTLGSPLISLRRDSANALGKIGDPIGTEALIGCLTHEDKFLQREAAIALIRIHDTKSIYPLIEYTLTRRSLFLRNLKVKTIRLFRFDKLHSWMISVQEDYSWRKQVD